MSEKIVKTPDYVAVRLDDAVTFNANYFIEPYDTRENGSPVHFGSFTFKNPEEAEDTLREAVQMLVDEGATDSVFEGRYPKFTTDSYGTKLKVNNKVKFYQSVDSTDTLVDTDEIEGLVWSLEVHLKRAKKTNEIYLSVPRAIAQGNFYKSEKCENDLFTDSKQVDVNDLF